MTNKNFKEDLQHIKALVFDIDGVLSSSTIAIDCVSGEPIRTGNVKDGFSIQLAIKKGLKIAIITGANTSSIIKRYNYLGVTDIYLSSKEKIKDYNDYKQKYQLSDEEILYMGDDLPDIPVLKAVGVPTCPRDAINEVKDLCKYISPCVAGTGCARDVIEQVLKAQNLWVNDDIAFGW